MKAPRFLTLLFFLSAFFLGTWITLHSSLAPPLRTPLVRRAEPVAWVAAASSVEPVAVAKGAVACCSDASPWVCVDGNAESTRAVFTPFASRFSIGFITYATGPYNEFVVALWESIQRFAFSGHDVHLFIFTDRANDAAFLEHPNVHKKQQARLGWPFDSLGRHFLYLQDIGWLRDMDYVFAIDSDALIVAPLDETMLGERVACLQAWSFGLPRSSFTYDARLAFDGSPLSTAYISPSEGLCYFCGGIFGGTLVGFTGILERTVELAQEDLDRVPSRIALWHDESYLNRAFADSPPTLVLGPAFMYPEPPADRWLYGEDPVLSTPPYIISAYTDLGVRRFTPRILNLGVRKHKEKTLDTFQPPSFTVPAFMTSAKQSKPLVLHGASMRFAGLVTIIIKAFERPSCIARLLNAVAQRFSGIAVIVLDDSAAQTLTEEAQSALRAAPGLLNLQYVRTEFDVGLSEGRNRMVALVETPYVLLMDDDFVLDDVEGLNELLAALESGVFDVAGGCVNSPQGEAWSYNFHESAGTLTQVPAFSCQNHEPPPLSTAADYMTEGAACWRVDSILNFFLARTDFLRRVKWDPRLKVGEHEDFFLRAKDAGGRVGMCRGATAANDNTCDATSNYRAQRRRVFDFWVEFFLKRDLRRLVTPAGSYTLRCAENHTVSSCTIRVSQDNIWFN